MRRQLKNKMEKIINKDTLEFEDFVAQSLYRFSKKDEYEIHLLEKILKALEDNNKLLQEVVKEPKK